jgi:tetratricopeptide (TPR) repeat protein
MLRPQERSTEKDSHDEMRSQRRRWRRNLGLSENSRFGTQSESDEENPDPLLLAESMQHFAEVNELLGRTWDAVEWLDAAVKLQGYRLDQSDPVLAESKKRLAEALRRVGQCEKAIKVLEDVADVLKKTRPDEPVLAADANASMANILLQAKRYDEAAELYRTALQDQQRARGAMHPSVAETLVNLGAAQRGQKSTAKALATYARAEKILRAQMKITGPLRLAALLRNMAVAHATDGDLDMAVERYEEAVELQRLHALGDGRAVLAETLAGLADVHKNRGELALTVKLYAEAVREREGLLNMWIREVDMRPDLGGNDLQGASVGDFGGKIAQEGVAALQAVCDAVLSAVVLREGGPRPSAEDSRRCRDMRLRPLYAGLASARHSLAIALMHLGDAQGTDAGTGEFQEAEELIEIVLRYRAALADTATLRPRQAGGGKDREQDGSGEGGDGGGEAGGDQEDLQLAESLAAKGALLRRRRQFDAGRAYLERALALCKKHKLPLDDRRIEFIESVLG